MTSTCKYHQPFHTSPQMPYSQKEYSHQCPQKSLVLDIQKMSWLFQSSTYDTNSLAPCAQREVYGICVGPILLQFTFTTVIFSHLKSSPALPSKFLLSRFWFSVCYTHHTICFISYGAHEVMTQFGKFIQQPNNKASLNSNRTQW